MREQLNTVKEQHDESFRDQKTKIDELQARVAQLEGERISLQEDFEKERQRSKQEMTEKDKVLHKGEIEQEKAKQHYVDDLRDKETRLKRSEARIAELGEELRARQEDHDKETQLSRKELAEKEKDNENLNTEIESKKHELRHYVERFKHQEEQHKSDLSLKEIEVKKLKQRLSQREKEVKRLNEELGQFKSRFAGICEKRVKQDQRKVENILASNQQSEVENDFREFFDSRREDARDIIQSLYGSEEEIDVHFYYPRIACTILETAYEHAKDVKEAVIDLFKVVTKNMVLHAPQEGYNFRLKRTEGSFDIYPISIDDLNASEKSTDVLDALLISLKETAHICNLECLEKDVTESSWKKWTEWFAKDASVVHAPTREVLVKLDSYIKACIRLTWRMVTQLPPLQLEYHFPRFDRHIHKKTAYLNSTEKNPGNEESLGEEILCYLWPGLLDGGGRLILQGQVLCKMQREKLK
ncbi:CAP-Gly domain-containing linker protein 1-like isoform X2 [Orbicella faveolata]|uniref:CAP-Gly domain-containing linker protein 1-like isoform X2 n=1 Tax=Orbicella faveolata TaxID=48498 RepID=UPI0009E3A6A2|nr:CAP-Gly domain-containing linker protein 1-like isoform X2 [Orbicella faveolata]